MRGIGVTVLLLLVLGGLGIALWLSGDGGSGEGESLTVAALDGRRLVRAERIVVANDASGVPLEFEVSGDRTWYVVEPVRDLASIARIEAIAAVWEGAQLVPSWPAEEVTAELEKETGLDEPRGYLAVRWPDGHEVRVEIGLPGPLGRDLFVRKDGAIWRAERSLWSALSFTPDDAREAFVFRNSGAQVERLRLTRRTGSGQEETLTVVRRGGGPWRLSEPASLRVDQERADSFVNGLMGLRIARFLRGAPTELGGPEAPPDAVIEVEGLAGPERVVLRELPDSGLFVGRSDVRDTWFAIESRDQVALLETPLLTLRAQWLLNLPVADVETVRIEGTDRDDIELVRRSGRPFELLQPVAARAWPTSVSELLQALRGMTVQEFVEDDAQDLAQYGLADGRVEITLGAGTWHSPDVLHLGADRGDGVTFLRRADEAHVVGIPTAVADVIRRSWPGYVDRTVTRIDGPSSVREVRCARGEAETVFARDDDGHWRRVADGEAVPLLDEVVDLLVGLVAEEVIRPERWAVAEAVRIQAVGVGDRVLAEVEVGSTDDGRYLARSGADAPFVHVLRLRDGRDLLELR